MLQKVKDNRLNEIQSRINEYGIRFPVSQIADDTGFDKGNVSSMLKGKKPISDNFWTKFQEVYPPKDLLILPHHGKKSLPADDIDITLQDYLDLQKQMIQQLNEDKEKLYGIINSGLAKISKDQQYALAYQKAWVDREAEKESGGDKQKKNQIKAKMGKLVDGFLPPDETGGSQSQ